MPRKMRSQPANPFHPGEILLEEFLIPARVSQSAFAKRIGWTRARLNELIRGKMTTANEPESGSACFWHCTDWQAGRGASDRHRRICSDPALPPQPICCAPQPIGCGRHALPTARFF